MTVVARTALGVFAVDEETDELVDTPEFLSPEEPEVTLPLLVAASSHGSTIVAVLDRRPPLAISHDAGTTWREAGAGLPGGRAVAIAPHDPDLVAYGARNRIYVSRDGGRFWSALTPELPEIEAVSWATA